MLYRSVIFCSLLLPALVCAQDFLSAFSGESPATLIGIEGSFRPDSSVERSSDKTHVLFHSADVLQRIYGNEKRSVSVGAKYQKLDLNSDHPFLRDYYDQEGSLVYKEQLPDQRFWMGSLSYGSASDKPFKNSRDNTLSANLVYKYNQRWFIVGNYSNNRSFLNNIPIPGVFYIKEMEKGKVLIIGIPLIIWVRTLNENWSVRYIGLLPWSHKFKLFYENIKGIRPFLGYEQQPHTFFRSDRDDRYDRFFWFERRFFGGVEGDFSKNLKYEFWSGYSFDRQFFEARNYSEKKDFLINLDSSFLLGFNLRFRF